MVPIFGSASAGLANASRTAQRCGRGIRDVERLAVPQGVANLRASRVKPDIPSEWRVARFDERFDCDLHGQQVRDEPLKDLGKRGKSAPTRGEIKGHVERIAALPVAFGVGVTENVDVDRTLQPEHRNQRRHGSERGTGNAFLVGGEQCALVQGHRAGLEQKLGRSEHKRVATAIERIAQDYVDKLIEKQRRRLAGPRRTSARYAASIVG